MINLNSKALLGLFCIYALIGCQKEQPSETYKNPLKVIESYGLEVTPEMEDAYKFAKNTKSLTFFTIDDLTDFLTFYGVSQVGTHKYYDFNNSGIVDSDDLVTFLSYFGPGNKPIHLYWNNYVQDVNGELGFELYAEIVVNDSHLVEIPMDQNYWLYEGDTICIGPKLDFIATNPISFDNCFLPPCNGTNDLVVLAVKDNCTYQREGESFYQINGVDSVCPTYTPFLTPALWTDPYDCVLVCN